MIVSCEHCQAQFRLDDSKIPATGARVRCSKCKHSFFIESPAHSDAAAAASEARSAVEGLGPGEAEESDWQFNHDDPTPEPRRRRQLDAARAAVDGLLGNLTRSEAAKPEPEPEPEPVAAPEPEPEPEREPQPEPEPERDPEYGAVDLDPSEDGAPLETEGSVDLAGEIASELDEDLGAPDEGEGDSAGWGLLDEDEADAEDAEEIGQMAVAPRWRLLEQERAARALASLEQAMPSRLGLLLERGVGAAGWLVTLALVAAGASGALAIREPARNAAEAVLERDGFRAEDVRGRWIENARVGPIYVVSGRLRATSRSAGNGALALQLLDASGEPIAVSSPVGPPFPAAALREFDPAELRRAQERTAPEFARMHPGEVATFQAVFPRVPPEAARFDLAP